ncbi:hypothetical protein DKX38_022027 [Salix brachista]|uniref:START domain-containing protein n=1 Tax=Salix brachista TaxID=2182728 RepID=A0A5N5JYJ5_9ROSI|nr:hypothetical protein DKX38_022027 [Salix brachista]
MWLLQLDRVSSIAAKYIGRPISQLPPVQPFHISSLDLTMGNFGGQGIGGPSLDLDLIPTSSNLAFQPPVISDMDKSLMTDVAANAMEELLRLLQTNEPLWMKSSADGRDVLNLDSYQRNFPRAMSHLKNPNVRIEASRDSGVVIMNGVALVNMFMDSNKWIESFPTIVSVAKTIEVISSGMLGSHSGSLQLWDVLSSGNAVQEVAHIANGSHPGNCISVLRAYNTSQNNMLILQESCVDSSGSLVVYCPVDLPAINIAMSGEDPSYIPLLPSGFTISPDGRRDQGDGASTSSNTQGSMARLSGSLITVAFQILVSSLPSAKLNLESVNTVNNLIGTTVQQIKAAMNCLSS